MGIILSLLINTIALYLVAYIIPGFDFNDFKAIFISAIFLAIANKFIKPVLHIVFLPLTLITFGLAAFFVNVLVLWGVSALVPGFQIDGFLTALLSSLLLTLVSLFLRGLEKADE